MATSQAQKAASAKWKKVHREQYNASQAKRALNRYQNDPEYREKKKAAERIYQRERYQKKKELSLKKEQEANNQVSVLEALSIQKD
tara:strand:+ start:3966 stop:4223 length:258 start_codon:yes stop_codon:yes gene_type:complete